jgi:hypothetical protein
LSDAELAEFLTTDGASEFEPMAGRKMRGYGMLAEPMSRDRRLRKRWIARSLQFVGSLPHKSAKTATSTKAGPKTRATTKTTTKGQVKKRGCSPI